MSNVPQVYSVFSGSSAKPVSEFQAKVLELLNDTLKPNGFSIDESYYVTESGKFTHSDGRKITISIQYPDGWTPPLQTKVETPAWVEPTLEESLDAEIEAEERRTENAIDELRGKP